MKHLLLFVMSLLVVTGASAQNATTYTTTSDMTQSMVKNTVAMTAGSNASGIVINPSDTKQKIDGFGYAITYASCYNLLKMTAADRHKLLEQTYSVTKGYGVSYARISIGCNDFSSTEYTLCDTQGLDNFALQSDETNYVIPILKEILAINPSLKIIAVPWTCPKWMKVESLTNLSVHDAWTDGHLNPAYRNAYARYFVKFINAMADNGISIYAVSPQNEPLNAGNCASLYMPADEEAPFVQELASTFKSNNLATKIYVFDHNYDAYQYPITVFNSIGSSFSGADLVAGSAFHNYAGKSDVLDEMHKQFPNKDLMFSEASIGTWNNGRVLSTRLVSDMNELSLGCVKRYCSSVMVWNFMLDRDMKPNLDGGCRNCYGAVDIDNSDYSTFAYNSFYYIIAHMSSVARAGAVRVATNDYSQTGLDYCAFRNTDGTTSIVLDNSSASSMTVPVTDGTYSMNVSLPAQSVVSVLFGEAADVPGKTFASTPVIPAAPVPAKDAADVKSLFSDAYTTVTPSWALGAWNQKTWTILQTLATGDQAYRNTTFNWLGFQYGGDKETFDMSDMTYLHLDIYPTSDMSINFYPITKKSDGTTDDSQKFTLSVTKGKWNSIDLKVSDFVARGLDVSKCYQIKFDGGSGNETFYLDNIYYWKTDGTNTSLGKYGSKALDASGNSTFDYAKGRDYVIIDAGTTSKSRIEATGNVRADYSVGLNNNSLDIWWYSYTQNASSGINSIGVSDSYRDYTVASQGWSGLGYRNGASGKDLSMLDGTYYLHFAIKGSDSSVHAAHQVGVGGALFTLGEIASDGAPVIGDFKRDGSWYNFDIPFSVFSNQASPVFESANGGASAYKENAVYFRSGGTAGTQLQFDNVFFYRKNLYLDATTSDGVAVLGGAWDAARFATIDAAQKATAYDLTSVDDLPSGASLAPADPNALFIVPAAGKIAKNEVVRKSDYSGYAGANIQFSDLYDDGASIHDVCTAISPITATSAVMQRTFSTSGIYFTTVVPFDVATLPSAAKAYVLTSSVKGSVTVLKFTEVKSLTKGTPYLIYTTSASANFAANGEADIYFTTPSVMFDGGLFKGTYTTLPGTTADDGIYILKKESASPVLYQSVGGTVPAFRSYVQMSSGGNAKSLNIEFDDAMGIHPATDDVIGSLLNVYSIDGRAVKNNVRVGAAISLPAGIYIVNGKKVVIK